MFLKKMYGNVRDFISGYACCSSRFKSLNIPSVSQSHKWGDKNVDHHIKKTTKPGKKGKEKK